MSSWFKIDGSNVVANLNSKVSYSHRVMSVQQSSINFLFGWFKTSTSHICFTHCLNFLQSKLVAKLIKCVVNLIQKLEKLIAWVAIDNRIKVVDIHEHSGHLTFLVREVLFSLSNLISYKRWHQDIEDRLQLEECPHFSVSIDELCLFLQLLTINIPRPNNSSENSNKGIECGHKGTELLRIWLCHEWEEDIHHDRYHNHNHSDVDVRVIQSRHQSQHKDEARWL